MYFVPDNDGIKTIASVGEVDTSSNGGDKNSNEAMLYNHINKIRMTLAISYRMSC